ncbi:cytochrome PufQ [Palleronia caenipelagi]|uniref:Protein pufQ n=1 Tax=Palleronia caenipelagi TaxID=2489174 RepID=A0A547Q7Q3_9RHOB|nr:cytochrome PufQ [Palleronia caenipelagi]TRD22393.1 protein pufQ [Palleronia caenipelagi]
MTDISTSAHVAEPIHRAEGLRTEFLIYFAIIFLATLPLACLTWALRLLRSGHWPDRGPIARAWTQARIITPMIFSA